MKKLLVSVVMLSLMLTTIAFAAYESDDPARYTELGNELSKLGMIEGDGGGRLNEGNSLTREQAIIILVRLNGWKAEAESYKATGVFSDVPANHWAARYVEFAKEKGLAAGIGGGKFGLGLNITAKEFAAMLLRALGYKADWNSDIMGQARELGITDNEGDGGLTMVRGQTFVYMINTLLLPKNGSKTPFFEDLGIGSDYLTDAASKLYAGAGEGKKPLKINLSKYPHPTGAYIKTIGDTPTFDEFRVTFDTSVLAPDKKNVKFTVSDGRTLDESNWTMAPGGNEIIFHFKDQNLHGKIVTCTIKNLKSVKGVEMLGDCVVSVQFRDYTAIQFVGAKVINEKSFETFLSIDVMPIPSLQHGYKVESDGVELVEGVDYKMSWGGNRFAPTFIRSEIYPKKEAKLTLWGYVTSPYHKFMDGNLSVTADFSQFGTMQEIATNPHTEPQEPLEPTVGYTIEDEDDIREIMSAWNESNTDYWAEEDPGYVPSSYDYVQDPSSWGCVPPYIYAHFINGNVIRFYTTARVDEVVNPVYTPSVYGTVQEACRIREVRIADGTEGWLGFELEFEVTPTINLNGGCLSVENLTSTCGAGTGFFDYYVVDVIN